MEIADADRDADTARAGWRTTPQGRVINIALAVGLVLFGLVALPFVGFALWYLLAVPGVSDGDFFWAGGWEGLGALGIGVVIALACWPLGSSRRYVVGALALLAVIVGFACAVEVHRIDMAQELDDDLNVQREQILFSLAAIGGALGTVLGAALIGYARGWPGRYAGMCLVIVGAFTALSLAF